MRSRTCFFFQTNGRCISGMAISPELISPIIEPMLNELGVYFSVIILSPYRTTRERAEVMTNIQCRSRNASVAPRLRRTSVTITAAAANSEAATIIATEGAFHCGPAATPRLTAVPPTS